MLSSGLGRQASLGIHTGTCEMLIACCGLVVVGIN